MQIDLYLVVQTLYFVASLLGILLINGNTSSQETLRQRLKLLTEEKSELQSQLMDCHLRIEQEGKVCEHSWRDFV